SRARLAVQPFGLRVNRIIGKPWNDEGSRAFGAIDPYVDQTLKRDFVGSSLPAFGTHASPPLTGFPCRKYSRPVSSRRVLRTIGSAALWRERKNLRNSASATRQRGRRP